MKNRIFFNHIDRSESLESFINDKTKDLDSRSSNWIISKEGQKDFKIKCVLGNQAFTETNKDPYQIVDSLVEKIERFESKKLKVAV